MLSAILVDDEFSTCQGLYKYIEWEELGIGRVETADSAFSALQISEALNPDILITDIRMPLMNGIELAQTIRKNHPSCRIIFISGYSDKEYLKSAIRLGAVNYVEKPLCLDEIKEAIAQAVALCREERKKRLVGEDIDRRMADNLFFQKQKLAIDLVKCNMDEGPMKEHISILCPEIQLKNKFLSMAAKIRFLKEIDSGRKEILKNEILTQMYDYSIVPSVFCTAFTDGDILVIHASFDSFSRTLISEEAKKIIETANRVTQSNSSAAIGIGKPVDRPGILRDSYERAVAALERYFFKGYGSISFHDDAGNENTAIWYPAIENFIEFLEANKKADAISYLKSLADNAANYSSSYISQIKDIFFKLTLALVNTASKRNFQLFENANGEGYLWKKMAEFETIFEIQDYLLELLEVFFYVLERKNEFGRSVYEIIKYMETNYSDNGMSVKKIAEFAHFSHFYLCSYFKINTGKTINGYITDLRIEKAKELLKDNRLKIYEVSSRIGYNNTNYFIRIFKKYVGLTPAEYKETYFI